MNDAFVFFPKVYNKHIITTVTSSDRSVSWRVDVPRSPDHTRRKYVLEDPLGVIVGSVHCSVLVYMIFYAHSLSSADSKRTVVSV